MFFLNSLDWERFDHVTAVNGCHGGYMIGTLPITIPASWHPKFLKRLGGTSAKSSGVSSMCVGCSLHMGPQRGGDTVTHYAHMDDCPLTSRDDWCGGGTVPSTDLSALLFRQQLLLLSPCGCQLKYHTGRSVLATVPPAPPIIPPMSALSSSSSAPVFSGPLCPPPLPCCVLLLHPHLVSPAAGFPPLLSRRILWGMSEW